MSVRTKLTEEQIDCLNEFIEKLEEKGLSPKERDFCDEKCLVRYLKARDWNVNKAHKMLRATLKWRQEFGVDSMTAEEIMEYGKTGKLYHRGADKEGRPVIFMFPGRENSKNYVMNMKYLVFTIEYAIKTLKDDAEQMVWFIDFNNYTKGTAPPISVNLEAINILNNHYPERLYRCFLVDTPWLFSLIWKAVTPFIHEKTKQKIKFVNGNRDYKKEFFAEYFDLNVLDKSFGGNLEYTYDHEQYWHDKLNGRKVIPKPISTDYVDVHQKTAQVVDVDELSSNSSDREVINNDLD